MNAVTRGRGLFVAGGKGFCKHFWGFVRHRGVSNATVLRSAKTYMARINLCPK